MTLSLNGLIPATILPMHADGRIDETALRSYITWVAGQGPVALAINVDTGEGPHLTHDEKVRVLQVVREVIDLPIVAGLACRCPLGRGRARLRQRPGRDHDRRCGRCPRSLIGRCRAAGGNQRQDQCRQEKWSPHPGTPPACLGCA